MISIIIPTANHLETCLKPCLESVIKYTNLDNIEIIVVGNGCTDDSKEYVESLGFKFLDFTNMLGYAKANNEGLKVATGDYFILLNDDTVLLGQEKNSWVNQLLEPFEKIPNCGLSGPMLSFNETINSDFLIFFCVMISRKCFESVGYLDEIFKEGSGEDIAYCMEAKKKGFLYVQVPNSKELNYTKNFAVGAFQIYHKGEMTVHGLKDWSEIFKRNQNILRERYKLESDISLLKKEYEEHILVVVPAFNAEETIKNTIDAILNQTFTNYTVIVINDASTDNTLKILQSYENRISIINNEKNLGVSKSRNRVLTEYASNKLIAFCDSDDIWTREHLSEQLQFLKSTNADLVCCVPYRKDVYGHDHILWGGIDYTEITLTNLLQFNRIYISSVLMKVEVWRKVGEFDSQLNGIEDWDYWIRAVDAGFIFKMNPKHTITYLVRVGSLAGQVSIAKRNNMLEKQKSKLKIRVIACCKNEVKMLPFFLQYYSQFVDQICIFDGGSDDGGLGVIKQYPKAIIMSSGNNTEMDERLLTSLRNEEYKKDRNNWDWQIIVDIDEFLYHPDIRSKLETYRKNDITIPKVIGYDMYSLTFPVYGDKTIIDQIRTGKRNDQWQSKSIIFNPNKVDINYDFGCHTCHPSGAVKFGPDNDGFMLLHYNYICYEHFIRRHKYNAARMSQYNKEHNLAFHIPLCAKMTEGEFNAKVTDATNIFEEKHNIKIGSVNFNLFLVKGNCGDPWSTERMIEVPLALWFMKKHNNQIIEIGAVTPYHTSIQHKVIDPYDGYPKCIRKDVNDLTYENENILSISTIEHVGHGEYNQKMNFNETQDALERIRKSNSYLVTWPIGYNIELDNYVSGSNDLILLKRTDFQQWSVISDLSGVQYGKPWNCGNGLCVITNCKELLGRKNERMKISIIIPTYNNLEKCLKPCCQSIIKNTTFSHTNRDVDIIVVANGCTDGTEDYVNSLGTPFKLLSFPNALGYTKATNEGIKNCTDSDYIILFNNDAAILDWGKDNWIDRLLEPFQKHENCAVTGPLANFCDKSAEEFLIFYLVMISQKALNKIGLLDEIFTPGGGEDTDFCIRARKAGMEWYCVSNSRYWINRRYFSDYPSYHIGEQTVHGLPNWNQTWKRNGEILKQRYNTNRILNKNKISIVIPSYPNIEAKFQRCCNSIIANTTLTNSLDIVIVASLCSNNIRDFILSLPKNFSLLSFDSDFPYQRALFEGVYRAKGDYIVVLNPNAVLLDGFGKDTWLNLLLQPFFIFQNCGITGPVKRQRSIDFNCAMISRKLLNTYPFADVGDYCNNILDFEMVQVPYKAEVLTKDEQIIGGFPIYY